MKIIVGLGNPGTKYESTWHNVGFLALDELQQSSFSPWKKSSKHKLLASEGNINGEKIILVKPLTFMNNSGEALSAVMSYYKVEAKDVYIIHDELDLPLGKIRVSNNSSDGGHNGIKSIISHLKTKDFVRFRMGIKKDHVKMPADKYVLKKIGLLDKMTVKKVIKHSVVPAVLLCLEQGLEATKNQYN